MNINKNINTNTNMNMNMNINININININTNININKNLQLELFFADDQVILAKSEDELQRSVCDLQNRTKDFNVEIYTVKTKVMVFQAKVPIRSKIHIYNKVTKQVNCFKYLGYCVT
jgi:hypothetical protein